MRLAIISLALALSGTAAVAQPTAPYDDSDPDMKGLMDTFFELVPCGSEVSGLCPEALGLLRGGGDRLAAYLIRQRAPEPGHPSRITEATYLRLIGYTESGTAFDHLSALVATRARDLEANLGADDMPLIFAIEGLGNTRDLRVLPIAFGLIDRFPNSEIRIRAVNAIDRVQAKHGPQPGVTARLTALQAAPNLAPSPTGQEPARDPAAEKLAQRVKSILEQPGETRP